MCRIGALSHDFALLDTSAKPSPLRPPTQKPCATLPSASVHLQNKSATQSPVFTIHMAKQHVKRHGQRKVAFIDLLGEEIGVHVVRSCIEVVDEVLAQDGWWVLCDVVLGRCGFVGWRILLVFTVMLRITLGDCRAPGLICLWTVDLSRRDFSGL